MKLRFHAFRSNSWTTEQRPTIGCLTLHGTHMTAINSTNNNVVFFFVSNLKMIYNNNYLSSITMPWTRKKKIFCVTIYLEAKFRRKFNFNNYHQKSQNYRWVHTFHATGSVNNLNKKAENPRSVRKLTARCFNNLDVVRDSIDWSPKKSLWKRSQELGLSRAPCHLVWIFWNNMIAF